MKKIILFFAVACLLTSCGNKSQNSDNREEAIEVIEDEVTSVPDDELSAEQEVAPAPAEEEAEEEGWKVPFSFETSHTSSYMNDNYKYVTEYQLLKNGKLKVTETKYEQSLGVGPWKEADKKEYGGKWSTTRISRGEGTQKVYVIDRSDYENSLYLPDDMEYFWNRGSGSSYFDCENYDLEKADKVENPKKL